MLLVVVLVSSLFLSAMGQQADDEWLDFNDMLNYDAANKRMRKPAEPASYENVPTKRREYVEEPFEADLTSCTKQVVDLQREIEHQKKTITQMSQQPSCNPVFKRFLSRLLKDIKKVGEPSDSNEVLYDAAIKLSKQAMLEIQALLDGEEGLSTGALDSAISQILVNLKPHNYESWKWRFEDTFAVDIDTLLKIATSIVIIMVIICTPLWSTVSWFVQFCRLFVVSFFISIIWNWIYLYKVAYAEHQNNIVKMDSFNEKCTGVKEMSWSDSLMEWCRRTWTFQDDPCKQYYEVLMVNPVWLVPPNKALSVTMTTFVTEPLKYIGKGISEFLCALLKDLPLPLQIPVLLTTMLAFVVCLYGGVQATFQHGILAPFQRPRKDPPMPPPELERQPQAQPRPMRIDGGDIFAVGDVPTPPAAHAPQPPQQQNPPQRATNEGHRNQVRQRPPKSKGPVPVVVETLKTADPCYSEGDETDAERPEVEQHLSTESDLENHLDERQGATPASTGYNTAQTETTVTKSDHSKSKKETVKEKAKTSKNEPDRGAEIKSQLLKEKPAQKNIQNLGASDEDGTSDLSLDLGSVPVQEMRQSPAE